MYGYLPQASRQMSTMRSAQILSNAISDMQRFYGLEVTGQMDPQTIRSAGLNCDVFVHLDLHTLIKMYGPQNTGSQTLVKLLLFSFAKPLKWFKRMFWPKIWKDRISPLDQWYKGMGNVFPSSVTAVEQSARSPQLLERSCSVALGSQQQKHTQTSRGESRDFNVILPFISSLGCSFLSTHTHTHTYLWPAPDFFQLLQCHEETPLRRT